MKSALVRLQTALDLGGITRNLRVENLIGMKNVCKNILNSHFESEGHKRFLDVSNALINKTDGSNPMKRETFWMHTLKTLAPYGLNVEDGFYNIEAMSS